MSVTEEYPAWIDEYTRSIQKAFSNMVPASWGPINFIDLFKHLNGAFIAKVAEAVRKLKEQDVSFDQVAECFPSRSTLRTLLYFLAVEYQYTDPKPREQFREVAEYLVAVINETFKEDAFAERKNITHTKKEISDLLTDSGWREANPQIARELGKLHNSLSAYIYSLYRDFYPQDALDIYGPYEVSDNSMLLVKTYNKLRPVDLWPKTKQMKHESIELRVIYEDIEFECEIIGMHSVYKGDLINGLKRYVLFVDGKLIEDEKEISDLSDYYAQMATEYAQDYDQMNKGELVGKSLEWHCYQLFYVFDLVGMDWRPTAKMKEKVKGKRIRNRVLWDSWPDYEEYVASSDYEAYWLKSLYV